MNYPYLSGIDGNELIDNMTKQAERFGATFVFGEVKDIDVSSKPFKLFTSDKTYLCRSLIISTGGLLDIFNLKCRS